MLRAGFGTKLAWLADRDQPVLFVGRDDDDGRRAGALAEAVGLTRFAGYLHGGMTSWRQEGRPAKRWSGCRSPNCRQRLAAAPALQVLDVRERSEWDEGHIPGSAFLSVARHPLGPRGARARPPDRRRMRVRPARGRRREPAGAPWRSAGRARCRRRCTHVGGISATRWSAPSRIPRCGYRRPRRGGRRRFAFPRRRRPGPALRRGRGPAAGSHPRPTSPAAGSSPATA